MCRGPERNERTEKRQTPFNVDPLSPNSQAGKATNNTIIIIQNQTRSRPTTTTTSHQNTHRKKGLPRASHSCVFQLLRNPTNNPTIAEHNTKQCILYFCILFSTNVFRLLAFLCSFDRPGHHVAQRCVISSVSFEHNAL